MIVLGPRNFVFSLLLSDFDFQICIFSFLLDGKVILVSHLLFETVNDLVFERLFPVTFVQFRDHGFQLTFFLSDVDSVATEVVLFLAADYTGHLLV